MYVPGNTPLRTPLTTDTAVGPDADNVHADGNAEPTDTTFTNVNDAGSTVLVNVHVTSSPSPIVIVSPDPTVIAPQSNDSRT